MQLRKATERDVDDYIEIEKSIGKTKLYSQTLTHEEAIEELSKTEVFFIVEEDRIVGQIAYEMKGKNHAYLSGICIKPDFQNRNLASQALKEILEMLKGVEIIDLVIHPENIKSIKLVESFGFVKAERVENYFGDGEPRVRYILKKQF